ncbi:MAG: hypothetical protein AB8B71_12690 [Paracoccaceae bacterium]
MSISQFDAKLMECLALAVGNLADIGVEPVFLGECPNKFNDAIQDDLWFAVQAGTAYWEQSHFFEHSSEPFVRERASYPVDCDVEAIKQSGPTVTSDLIAHLREKLRSLQKQDWRALCNWDGLAALVIERNQPWLVLEHPNGLDGEVYSWNEAGMFNVGTVERIDQRVGKNRVLIFKTIDPANVAQLGDVVRRYLEPQLQDAESAMTLAGLLREAVDLLREATDKPFAMCSRNSRDNASSDLGFLNPVSYCADLRHKEGEFRVPRDGKWPMFQPNFRVEATEYSDLAKLFHTCLKKLEDSCWRDLFGQAFDETLEPGQHLALYADAGVAVLMRDNAAFEITHSELKPLGVFDYPNIWDHEAVIKDLKQGL